jgi:hypothetical protein
VSWDVPGATWGRLGADLGASWAIVYVLAAQSAAPAPARPEGRERPTHLPGILPNGSTRRRARAAPPRRTRATDAPTGGPFQRQYPVTTGMLPPPPEDLSVDLQMNSHVDLEWILFCCARIAEVKTGLDSAWRNWTHTYKQKRIRYSSISFLTSFLTSFHTRFDNQFPSQPNQLSNKFSNPFANKCSHRFSNQFSFPFSNICSHQFSNPFSNKFSHQLSNQCSPQMFTSVPIPFFTPQEIIWGPGDKGTKRTMSTRLAQVPMAPTVRLVPLSLVWYPWCPRKS